MPANLMPSGAEFLCFVPEIILTTVATLLLMLEAVLSRQWRRSFGHISMRRNRFRGTWPMPANLMPSGAELLRFVPEIILTPVATLLLMLEAVLSRQWRRSFGHVSMKAKPVSREVADAR